MPDIVLVRLRDVDDENWSLGELTAQVGAHINQRLESSEKWTAKTASKIPQHPY